MDATFARQDRHERPPARRPNGTILCALVDPAVDGAAVEAAGRIAARFGARVVLVSVAAGGLRDRRSNERHRLAQLATQHGLAGVAEHRVERGPPVETVAIVAGEEAAELIVVGARAGTRRDVLRSRLGRDLAAAASCPVLVAPPDGAPAPALGVGNAP